MNATTKNDLLLCEKLAIDTPQLAQILSCGRATAVQIGEAAEAKICVGKRILWNCNKVKIYLDAISTD